MTPKRRAKKAERLSRGTLDRETVVTAALEIADRDGLAAVTMARVAGALGAASPMALYRHLHDKQALLDAIADRALSELPALARDRRPWRVRLEEYAAESRRNALRHPALVEIVQQTWVRGSGGAQVGLDIIALLRDAGFDMDSSIRAYMAFRNHIVGFLAWEISRFRRGSGDFAQQITDTFGRGNTPADSPLRRFSQVVGKEPEALFLFGIGRLLDGFEAELRRTRGRSGQKQRSRDRDVQPFESAASRRASHWLGSSGVEQERGEIQETSASQPPEAQDREQDGAARGRDSRRKPSARN